MYRIGYLLSNRATYYRSKVLLQHLNRDEDIELILFVTSSLLEEAHGPTLSEISNEFDIIRLPVDCNGIDLYHMARSATLLAKEALRVLPGCNLDLIVLNADRHELLPVGMVCSYLYVPIAHIQCGEFSGNIDNKVRHAVSMLSDLWFPTTEVAHKVMHGLVGCDNSHFFGCPSIDLIAQMELKRSLHSDNNIVLIFHPHTDEVSKAEEQAEIVKREVYRFAVEYGAKIHLMGTNNDPGFLDVQYVMKDSQNLKGEDFLTLLAGSRMIVGNSSASIRESAYLGVPSVLIGGRQRNRVHADNVIRSGFNDIYMSMKRAWDFEPEPSYMFGDGNASSKIVNKIKEFLWEKQNGKRKL
jgi:UDP-hydrolysing UDP-N-acetyl-D-glucosamine 2-epimerase